jgi:DNA-binding PadR family transcriptional regulator
VSVRHAILALLSEGPKYGLQLQKEFESSTGEIWPLNIGQVYTTLQASSATGSSSPMRRKAKARRRASTSPTLVARGSLLG